MAIISDQPYVIRFTFVKKVNLSQSKLYNNPFFTYFSIAFEILIFFELTLFVVLAFSSDNRENEVPESFRKAYSLIT